jgi:hypothetical protein
MGASFAILSCDLIDRLRRSKVMVSFTGHVKQVGEKVELLRGDNIDYRNAGSLF